MTELVATRILIFIAFCVHYCYRASDNIDDVIFAHLVKRI